MARLTSQSRFVHGAVGLVLALSLLAQPVAANAQVTAFRQAVAETASQDDDIAAFYRSRNFEGIWTGTDAAHQERRNALLAAFADAPAHGLPAARYNVDALIAQMRAARTPAELGVMDVTLSRLFLQYAHDVQTGILDPQAVVPEIKREVQYRDKIETLSAFLDSRPARFLRELPPQSPEYTRLMREKLRLEALLAQGGWGPSVRASRIEPGQTGPEVIALRNRLIDMGYMDRSVAASYDSTLTEAVRQFQLGHGLVDDGVAGAETLKEINIPLEERLQSVLVAMERERWINQPLGSRYIWVNLTDFTAAIVDDGRVTFSTRSVIGANDSDRQSPEFSDVMDHMVINPSWYVPRSIITKEYLPQLQRNANAVSHIDILNSSGRVVSRGSVNFAKYNERTFPFSMRQPPSEGNALGLVKFMFPNPYNIYLHDTPAKSLFSRDVRAFSHGCIRLNDPFDFAYALLARQESDPEDFFQRILRTKREARVDLVEPVPVHLVYRTAFTHVDGTLQFRRDVYGRDARIWQALEREGVAVTPVQG